MKRILYAIVLVACFCLVDYRNAVFAQVAYEVTSEEQAKKAELENKNVSLDFKDADLKDVLKVFSQQSGLNFISSRNVETRKITLYMENVAVEDALQALLSANNLGLEQSPNSNIIIVKDKPAPPVDTITRVYKMRYIHARVPVGLKILDGAMWDRGGPSSATQGSPAATKGAAVAGVENELVRMVSSLISPYGTVVSFSNVAIITDIPERFKLIDQVISEIDKPLPEVMLEVELIETTTDFLENLGIKWSKEFGRYSGPGAITPVPYTHWEKATEGDGKVTYKNPGADFYYGFMSSQNLQWVLEMLKSDSNTKFLSKPRILVQDKEWAEIRVTANQVVSIKSTSTAGGGETTTTTEAERMEVGTILRILPTINEEEGFVTLLLEPSISRPVASAFSAPDGTSFVDPHTRSIHTMVMVKHKETCAIGGFITTEDQETKTKVPWLGDIPLFGAMFRHKYLSRVDKELLIFITPIIVSPTQKMVLTVEKEKGKEEEKPAQVKEDGAEKQPLVKEQESVSAPVPVREKELSFREQEDMSDLKIDLTFKSSNLGTVDLIK